MTDLTDLLARVEQAEGPDRELDKALWYKLVFDPALADPDELHWLKFVGQKQPWFTASLDASLALVERVLPGWTWDIGCDDSADGRYYTAILWAPDYKSDSGEQFSKNRSLSVLIALLKVLIKHPL